MKCWTCGGAGPHPSGAVCICGGSGLHDDEVTNLRLGYEDLAGKMNYTVELLRELRNYVAKSLPTHLERGGDADRQKLLKRIDKVIDG